MTRNCWRFDIRTVSEANFREHWASRVRRKKAQQREAGFVWRALGIRVALPAVITFTRHSSQLLDSDNLAGAFKHVRDEIARQIGVDDGDPRIEWRTGQVRENRRVNYFTVTVEEKEG